MSSPLTSSSLATPGGVKYAMVEGFPTFDMDRDGVTYIEKIRINSSDVPAFVREVLPAEAFVYLGMETLPLGLFAANGVFPAEAKQIHLEPAEEGLPGNPWGGDTRSIPTESYCQYYLATITYQVSINEPNEPPEPTAPETFTVHSVTGGGQALTISPQELTLHKSDVAAGGLTQDDNTGNIVPAPAAGDVESNANLLQPIVKLIPTVEHSIELAPKTSPNWTFIISSLGKINKNAMTSYANTPLYGAAKETLLFSGFSGTRQYTVYIDENDVPQYQSKWTLQMRITQRHVEDGSTIRGWNHVWSPKHQAWKIALQTLQNGNKRPLYKRVDFDTLLRNENA